jgi:hypothetical protein
MTVAGALKRILAGFFLLLAAAQPAGAQQPPRMKSVLQVGDQYLGPRPLASGGTGYSLRRDTHQAPAKSCRLSFKTQYHEYATDRARRRLRADTADFLKTWFVDPYCSQRAAQMSLRLQVDFRAPNALAIYDLDVLALEVHTLTREGRRLPNAAKVECNLSQTRDLANVTQAVTVEYSPSGWPIRPLAPCTATARMSIKEGEGRLVLRLSPHRYPEIFGWVMPGGTYQLRLTAVFTDAASRGYKVSLPIIEVGL